MPRTMTIKWWQIKVTSWMMKQGLKCKQAWIFFYMNRIYEILEYPHFLTLFFAEDFFQCSQKLCRHYKTWYLIFQPYKVAIILSSCYKNKKKEKKETKNLWEPSMWSIKLEAECQIRHFTTVLLYISRVSIFNNKSFNCKNAL